MALLKCVRAGLLSSLNTKEVRSHSYFVYGRLTACWLFEKLITLCIICISLKLVAFVFAKFAKFANLCGKLSPDSMKH